MQQNGQCQKVCPSGTTLQADGSCRKDEGYAYPAPENPLELPTRAPTRPPTTYLPPVTTTRRPCPDGLILTSSGACVCPNGLELQNGRCIRPTTEKPSGYYYPKPAIPFTF